MKKQRYIMHLDGDAFFVSVEAAKDPALRGRPVVTGQERGIASAMSYEAKALGITRAMPIFQIRKQFPQVVVVDSDYEAYAVFSRRMIDIVRRYTDTVEEYSIDECFADFTDVEGFSGDPEKVLAKIKDDVRKELGISVSLGLAPTRVLAKVASKSKKPDGLTVLDPRDVPELLSKTSIGKIWGIGSATAIALRKKGIVTARDFASKPLGWVEETFSKPLVEMWYELNCVSVHPVAAVTEAQKSIMKTRTFSPATRDREYVFSELSKNIENACRKARESGLLAREFSVYLKTRDFSYLSASRRLAVPSNDPFEIVREARRAFDGVFEEGRLYRATGTTLYGLVEKPGVAKSLFDTDSPDGSNYRVLDTIDKVNKKYGRSVVRIASSERAVRREEAGERPLDFMPRGVYKKLSIPYLGEAF